SDLRRGGWLGLAKAFWNSGYAWMNLMRARFVRAACGMSSRFASPRLILRSKDFKAASWPGLNELWHSGFLATSSRAEQPQQQTGCASHSAPMAALACLFSHAFRIASLRSVVGCFSFSDSSVVILPLKYSELFGHKIMGCPLDPAASSAVRGTLCKRSVPADPMAAFGWIAQEPG